MYNSDLAYVTVIIKWTVAYKIEIIFDHKSALKKVVTDVDYVLKFDVRYLFKSTKVSSNHSLWPEPPFGGGWEAQYSEETEMIKRKIGTLDEYMVSGN